MIGGGGGGALIAAVQNNNNNNSLVPSNNNNNNGSGGGGMTYRPQMEDKRLTREAMARYMNDRNDMVIVILHAKVRIEVTQEYPQLWWNIE